MRSARTASNSAISSFYKSEQWIKFCTDENNDYGGFELAATLHRIRQLVDGGVKGEGEDEKEKSGEYWDWDEDQNNIVPLWRVEFTLTVFNQDKCRFDCGIKPCTLLVNVVSLLILYQYLSTTHQV